MTTLKAVKSDHLTPDELQDEINTLLDADIFRLKEIARKYVGGHELAADDLVQEAIYRALSGKRKTCPSGLSIISFLAGVMKSITYDARQEASHLVHFTKDETWEKFSDAADTQEVALLKAEQEREYYQALEVFFDGDDESLLMTFYLQNGYSPAGIRKAENWNKTQYDTIRKRIRRKINDYLKGKKL